VRAVAGWAEAEDPALAATLARYAPAPLEDRLERELLG
jgi:hypothetical protein